MHIDKRAKIRVSNECVCCMYTQRMYSECTRRECILYVHAENMRHICTPTKLQSLPKYTHKYEPLKMAQIRV